MPRRCAACGATTPPFKIQCCPSCGQEFRKPENDSASPINKIHATNKHSSHSQQPRVCPYKSLCVEYLRSLEWDQSLFDRRFNRCYCSDCYLESWSDVVEVVDSIYVIPRGWCRFGLQVDKVRTEVDHIWHNWIVTYHGTIPAAAQSIVVHRQFLIPGDKRLDGEKIAIRSGHIEGQNHIYTSPTIAYSAHPCYCQPQLFRSRTTNKVYKARIVLQCRQQPGSFKVQPETIGAGHNRICSIIPNDKVEIYTTVRASVLPYGILIQLEETS
ncbi:unnamed protein product [Rotaria sordida]|uniref:Uncharacterized protein n=1 Tax=Rotaria sordida TaxID=392033 RepID=A0A814WPI7_9BILA|nr:unnamed protein product [Rotaria sordida]CAF1296064.1 unnamed protein product [Rotaria sordida]CAF1570502.1 unnamed protein product [Rotaria sordida]